jgi:hypothetical protein
MRDEALSIDEEAIVVLVEHDLARVAPEPFTDPVAEQTPPVLLPATDVSGDLPVVDDRLLDQGVVREDALPVGVEGSRLRAGKSAISVASGSRWCS